MRFHPLLASIVLLAVFVLPTQTFAASPAFALSFKFDPPFNVTTPVVPALYLDVCDEPDCSIVKRAILMNCSTNRAPPGNNLVIVGCMAHAIARLSFPDSEAILLSRPVNLRIRTDNLISQVFPFAGGQPVLPETFYNFVINPAAAGFSVTPG